VRIITYSLTTILVLFIALPFIVIVGSAFGGGSYIMFPPDTYSLRWFSYALQRSEFVSAFRTSVLVALVSTTISLLVSLPAVVAVGRMSRQYQSICLAIFLSPISLPSIVLGVGILALLLGLGIGLGMFGLLAAHIILTFPFAFRTLFASYDASIRTLEEASRVLGAGKAHTMIFIVVPALRNGIIAAFLLCFLVSFDEVAVSLLLSSPTATTLPVAVFSYLLNNFDPSVSVIATLQMLLSVFIVIGADRFVRIRVMEGLQ